MSPLKILLKADDSPAGQVERTHITDVISRPRPIVVAGRLENSGSDFATRTFEMVVHADPTLGDPSTPDPFEIGRSSTFRFRNTPQASCEVSPGRDTGDQGTTILPMKRLRSGPEPDYSLPGGAGRNQASRADEETGRGMEREALVAPLR